MRKEKKQRVNYNWLGHKQARVCKAFLAVCADHINWEIMFRKKKSVKKAFKDKILPRVQKTFPGLLSILQRAYTIKGRTLTIPDYHTLLYCRLAAMFLFDRKNKLIKKTVEHPLNTGNKKLRSAYFIARKLYKKCGIYNNEI